MHTALRLGVALAARVRIVNPTCHIAFYGLYAALNAEYLLKHAADSVMSGEIEDALVELVQQLERSVVVPKPRAPSRPHPILEKLAFPLPSRSQLPALKRYAHVEKNGALELAGYVEASRGCKHLCRHCPIPPVYGGRFFVVPREVVLADIRNQVSAGATHLTFGDPDFLNGPGHSLAILRAASAEFPLLTFDFTAKIEHLLKHRDLLPDRAEMRPHLGTLDAGRFTYDWRHPDARMDLLHRELSSLVEKAALDGEDPRLTFDRIVARVAARPLRTISPIVRDKGRPPR